MFHDFIIWSCYIFIKNTFQKRMFWFINLNIEAPLERKPLNKNFCNDIPSLNLSDKQ